MNLGKRTSGAQACGAAFPVMSPEGPRTFATAAYSLEPRSRYLLLLVPFTTPARRTS